MSYPYFFVDKNFITPDSVFITGEDFNHLVKVLRARVGDTVEISDNETKRYNTVLAGIKKDQAVLQIKRTNKITKSPHRISLFQCMLKKEAMEFAIQKTAEIGVDRIIPVLSARTVVDIGEKKIKDKICRWQQIALSASKQCKRDFICEIAYPVEAAIIDAAGYNLFFLPVEDLYLDDKAALAPELENTLQSLKDIIKGLKDKEISGSFQDGPNPLSEIAYIVGPEGGFEKKEVLDLVRKGAISINFGTNILRSETASVYFLSILDYLLKVSIA
jgi:16S rRNA (uracil1498-N3)-methyltransferase